VTKLRNSDRGQSNRQIALKRDAPLEASSACGVREEAKVRKDPSAKQISPV